MTDDRRAIIMRRAWARAALKERATLATSLSNVLTSYAFLEEEASRDFGQRYWSKANAMAYETTLSLEVVLAKIQEQRSIEELVVWLHSKTNVAGAIFVSMNELIEHSDKARQILGPDLLLADSELSFGVCFEVDEYETFLRWWG